MRRNNDLYILIKMNGSINAMYNFNISIEIFIPFHMEK